MNSLLKDFESDKQNFKKIFGPIGSTIRNSAMAVGVPALQTAVGNKKLDGGITLLQALSLAAISTITNFSLIKQEPILRLIPHRY